jgi:hypothetical protein
MGQLHRLGIVDGLGIFYRLGLQQSILDGVGFYGLDGLGQFDRLGFFDRLG